MSGKLYHESLPNRSDWAAFAVGLSPLLALTAVLVKPSDLWVAWGTVPFFLGYAYFYYRFVFKSVLYRLEINRCEHDLSYEMDRSMPHIPLADITCSRCSYKHTMQVADEDRFEEKWWPEIKKANDGLWSR